MQSDRNLIAVGMQRGKMKEIRFAIPDKLWLEWVNEAGRLHIPLNLWARLRISGELAGKPVEIPTAPVQETTQEKKGTVIRPASGWLRERIVAEIGDEWFHRRDIPRIAKTLGEPSRSVATSIQSMVNSKRAVYDKDTGLYRIVKGE